MTTDSSARFQPSLIGRRALWAALALAGVLLCLFAAYRPAAAGIGDYNLTVVKQAWQPNGLDPYPGDWAFDIACQTTYSSDCADITLTDDDASHSYYANPLYSYTLTETVPDGWTASVSCKDSSNQEIASGENSVEIGATYSSSTITCTFTNVAEPTTGTLIVNKDAQPNDPQDFNYNLYHYQPSFGLEEQFSLDDDGADSNPLSNTYETTLTPGPYGVSEAGTPGWVIAIECVSTDPDREFPGTSDDPNNNGRGIAFDIAAGETITCTFINTPPPPAPDVFVSATVAGTTGDGLAFGPHDILGWNGAEWTKFFDGSAAGLTPAGPWMHNINAFFVEPPATDFVLLSFAQNSRVVPGVGLVDGMDIVAWDGSGFQLVFDGQDVGLTNKTQEKIDGLHLQPGPAAPAELIAAAGGSCQVYLLISTQGPGKVPNYSGGTLNFGGEDVLGFCVTSNGDNTAGKWIMVLDGSQQGMPRNSTDSIGLSADGNVLYLTTRGAFNVDTATGGHSMVYGYDLVNEEFFGPLFVADDEGLPRKVDGLQYDVMP